MTFRNLVLRVVLCAIPSVSFGAQEEASTKIQVEVVICDRVEERQPLDASAVFSEEVGQVAAWTRITGAADSWIEHVWRYKDHEFVVPLHIGGSPWRTWSTKMILPEWTGEWTFEVRDTEGAVLSTNTFTIGGED